jgi:hypothetical protein
MAVAHTDELLLSGASVDGFVSLPRCGRFEALCFPPGVCSRVLSVHSPSVIDVAFDAPIFASGYRGRSEVDGDSPVFMVDRHVTV